MTFSGPFDTYELKARAWPALLIVLPWLIAVYIWLPGLATVVWALAPLAIGFGVVFVLADIARDRGKALEVELIDEWGGLPTTIWLRHRDQSLDANTRARYHRYIERKVQNITMPLAEEEHSNPGHADELYAAAARWLRDRASSDKAKYRMVFLENVSYGFRRNMLGLRPIAIGINLAVLIVGMFFLYGDVSRGGINPLHTVPIIIAVLFLIYWSAVVRRSWVRRAGDEYARALLATCDASD